MPRTYTKINHGVASITTSAAQLTIDEQLHAINGVEVRADLSNGAIVYVGGVGVTTATGFPLQAGESINLPIRQPSKIYLISASGTLSVRYILV